MHALEQQLLAEWPSEEWSSVTVIAAVSGGADSMALLRGLHAVRRPGAGRLLVAHFNHRLRGTDSDDDESFVREQSALLGCPCEVGTAEARAPAAASESSARQARYDFLRQVAQAAGARCVATAHTADDQAETILHRILRGTGLAGLAGIPACRELVPGVALVRPLLTLTRADVLAYLDSIDQPFRTDLTNADSRFTRNRIRHELLPLLAEAYNPRVRESLVRLGQLAEEAAAVLADIAAQLRQQAVIQIGPQCVEVDCSLLHTRHRYLVCQLLMEVWREQQWGQRDMTREHWQQLADLAIAPAEAPRCITLPGAIRAVRDGHRLVLTVANVAGNELHETLG